MSRPRATSARCVMNQPVRRKTDADATGDESPRRDRDILWKTPALSSGLPRQNAGADTNPLFFLPLHVKPRPGITGLRRLTFEARVRSAKLAADFAQKMRPKRKTRPGGQPGGASSK